MNHNTGAPYVDGLSLKKAASADVFAQCSVIAAYCGTECCVHAIHGEDGGGGGSVRAEADPAGDASDAPEVDPNHPDHQAYVDSLERQAVAEEPSLIDADLQRLAMPPEPASLAVSTPQPNGNGKPSARRVPLAAGAVRELPKRPHPQLRICREHLQELCSGSAISTDLLQIADVETVEYDNGEGPRRLRKLGIVQTMRVEHFPALLFNYRNMITGDVDTVAVKPRVPWTPKPGAKGGRPPKDAEDAEGDEPKGQKYLRPKNRRSYAYIPPGVTLKHLQDSTIMVVICEGQKKALSLASHMYGPNGTGSTPLFIPIGLDGVHNWGAKDPDTGIKELFIELKIAAQTRHREIYIAYDSDRDTNKITVEPGEKALAKALARLGLKIGGNVYAVRLRNDETGKKVGIDDFLAGFHFVAAGDWKRGHDAAQWALLKKLDEARELGHVLNEDERRKCSKVQVVVTTDIDKAMTDIREALRCSDEFMRYGELLCHVKPAQLSGATVKAWTFPTLYARVSRHVNTLKLTADGDLIDIKPDRDVVRALLEETEGFRELHSIACAPRFCADGRVLTTPGLDEKSGIFYHKLPGTPHLNVPDAPTAEDLARSKARIDALVAQFPFATESSLAAWVAYAATLIARPAIDSYTPGWVFTAPGKGKGIGKTALLRAAYRIATGLRYVSNGTWSAQEEEQRKRITGMVLKAGPALIFDNNKNCRVLDSHHLDSLLTSDVWSDRILGRSEELDLFQQGVVTFSGNGLTIGGDASRRFMCVHLDKRKVAPNRKLKFDIKDYAYQHRWELLEAFLTLMRGWHVAGRPDHGLTPWASYEDWDRVVRSMVIWAGWADPVESVDNLVLDNDEEEADILTIIDHVRQGYAYTGATVSDLLDDAYGDDDRYKNTPFGRTMRDLMGRTRPDPRAAGKVLNPWVEHQVTDGWYLKRRLRNGYPTYFACQEIDDPPPNVEAPPPPEPVREAEPEPTGTPPPRAAPAAARGKSGSNGNGHAAPRGASPPQAPDGPIDGVDADDGADPDIDLPF